MFVDDMPSSDIIPSSCPISNPAQKPIRMDGLFLNIDHFQNNPGPASCYVRFLDFCPKLLTQYPKKPQDFFFRQIFRIFQNLSLKKF